MSQKTFIAYMQNCITFIYYPVN